MWFYEWFYEPSIQRVLCAPGKGEVRWHPEFFTLHDPCCPWGYRVRALDTELVKRMKNWKNLDYVMGDAAPETTTERSNNLMPGQVDLTPGNIAGLRPSSRAKYTTVVEMYERGVESSSTYEKPGSDKALKREDQYQICSDDDGQGCGYRTQTVGQQWEDGSLEKGTMPPAIEPGACPDCLANGVVGDLQLVTRTVTDLTEQSNNRLTIFAPYEIGPDGGPLELWSGPWPHGIETPPFVVYFCYLHPAKVMGQSETSLNWTYQLGSNLIDRIGLEHMLRAKPYIQIPDNAVDWKGDRWVFGDEQGLGIFTDPSAPPGSFNVLQAPGLPPAWATLRQAYDAALQQGLGTSDIALPENAVPDVPVGTVEALQSQREIPVTEQISRFQEADIYGLHAIAYPMMRATLTDKLLVRMKGQSGLQIAAMIRPSDMPDMTITIADQDSLNIREGQVDTEIKILSAPPPLRRILARRNNIPLSDIEQLEKDEQEWEATHPPIPAGPGVPPGAPPSMGGGMRTGPPPMAPPMGAGMAPALSGAA